MTPLPRSGDAVAPSPAGIARAVTVANSLRFDQEETMASASEIIHDKAHVSNILDASINIGLTALLVISCLVIVKPFVPLLVWGMIIAIASYPRFEKLKNSLGGRGGWAAAIWSLLLLLILILPIFLFARGVVESGQILIARIHDGTLSVPPPPAGIETWPLIGAPFSRIWTAASADLTKLLIKFAPEIKSAIPVILSASAGVGFTVMQFFLGILVSGALLANAPAVAKLTRALCIRIFGEKGPEYQQLVGSTVRSVTFGILGVALIQSAFAAVGFVLVGIPGAGAWSVIFLVAALLQVGVLVLIPAVVYMLATASSTKASIFLVWCMFVAVMDNVLKPILLGRGAVVPIMVVFLGAIGGFVALGIIGLFLGAIVLSVGYKLLLAWIGGRSEERLQA
jgi:predicted PurR-regulated permease PerM